MTERLKNGSRPRDPENFRGKLLQEEFRNFLTKSDYTIPVDSEAVVVLSGPIALDAKGDVMAKTAADDIARIHMGIEVARAIVSKRLNKETYTLTPDEIRTHAPALVLNGTTDQLVAMKKIALDAFFPIEKIEVLDCGAPGVGNTKTQFEVMNSDERYNKNKKMTFITNAWHAPRVARTGDKNLKQGIDFDIIPVPLERVPYNIFSVRGEVRRIEIYSVKGDIKRQPKRGIPKKG